MTDSARARCLIRVRRIAPPLLAILILSCPAPASAAEHPIPEAHALARLAAGIEAAIDERAVPGCAAAVVAADPVLWARGFGVENQDTGAPVTPHTVFRAGSISKTLTALGIMRLVEEGRLDLETPVADLAPEIEFDNPWRETDPVRVVHLLEHTSGIEDVHFREVYDLRDDVAEPLSLGEVLAISPATRSVRWPPGTHVAYSNHGYTIAGYLIEQLSGESFEAYLGRTVLDPLAMTASTFEGAGPGAGIAQGYAASGEPYPFAPLVHRPASSLQASVNDMARLVQCFLNRGRAVGGRALIDSASVTRMETSTSGLIARAGHRHGYGIGNRARYWRGHRYQGHGGGLPDFSSVYGYFPDLDVGFVVLINSGDADALAALRRLVLDVLVPDPALILPPSVPISTARCRSLVGRYQYANPDRALDAFPNVLLGGFDVSFEGDTLYVEEHLGSREALVPVTEHQFRRVGDPFPSIVFSEREDGRLVLGEPLYRSEYVRVRSWVPTVHRLLLTLALILMLTVVMHALVWVPAWLVRGVRSGRLERLAGTSRFWSLASALALVGMGGALAAWARQPIRAGVPSIPSIAFTLAGWMLLVFSSLAFVLAIREWRSIKSIASRAHRLVAAMACVAVTMYLAFWGIIGLRLWAY